MKKALLISLLLFCLSAGAQESKEIKLPTDSIGLQYALQHGKFTGRFRYYFMATDNDRDLTDYYANAVGGSIKYETAKFKGFQLGISSYFIFNIGSSDLIRPDAKTSQANRYEMALFDINDPGNKTNLGRMEELYIKYNWRKSAISFGRQLINTPFINLQDGRMRPTEVGGVWMNLKEIKNTKIETGYLYQISPRGTTAWYSPGETLGILPTGVNTDGSKAQYKGNIKSNGIAILGITHQLNKVIAIQAWDVFAENIFNTIMLQLDYSKVLTNNSKLIGGLQSIYQSPVNDGGNNDPLKTYFDKSSYSVTIGGRIGWENKQWQTSVNYNRITKAGRYLMPREWGRDPFFTFLQRERNDGLGDVHAYMVKAGRSFDKARLKTMLAAGYYDLPEANDYRLNKYGVPSYIQYNINLQYAFAGLMKGLEAEFLFAYKTKQGNSYGNDRYVINKVDMASWNFMMNYRF